MKLLLVFALQLWTVVSHDTHTLSCISRTSLSPQCRESFGNLLQKGSCELEPTLVANSDYALRHPRALAVINASKLTPLDYVTLFEIPGIPLLIRGVGNGATWGEKEAPAAVLKEYASKVSPVSALTALAYAVGYFKQDEVREFESRQGQRKQLVYVLDGEVDVVVCGLQTVARIPSASLLFERGANTLEPYSNTCYFLTVPTGALLTLPGDFGVSWKSRCAAVILEASYISIRDYYDEEAELQDLPAASLEDTTVSLRSLKRLQSHLRITTLLQQAACESMVMEVESASRTTVLIKVPLENRASLVQVQYANVDTGVSACLTTESVEGTLEVQNMMPSHKYIIRGRYLSARWDIQCSWSIIHKVRLADRGPPAPPRDAQVALNGETHVMQWRVPEDDGGLPIQGFVIMRSESVSGPFETAIVLRAGDSYEAELVNMRPGVQYFLKIGAMNAIGTSNFTAPVAAPVFERQKSVPIGGVFSPYHHLSRVTHEPIELTETEVRLLKSKNQSAFGLLSDAKAVLEVNGNVIQGWSGHFSPKLYDVHAPLYFDDQGACGALTDSNAHSRILVVERGGCPLYTKAAHAAAVGAMAIVFVAEDEDNSCMLGSSKKHGDGFASTDDSRLWKKLHLPALMVERKHLKSLNSFLHS